MLRARVLLSCLAALAIAGCIQDADTILEPDRSADAAVTPDEAPAERFPAVEIEPATLAFAARGDLLELTIRSVGDAPLFIEGIGRDGNPGFAAVHDGQNALLLGPGALGGEGGLPPGESVVLTVEALVAPPASAVLNVRTNDPDQPLIEVPVGFPDVPCVRVEPGELDFGGVALGETVERAVQVLNCGSAPVNLAAVSLREGTDETFELAEPVPELGEIAAGAAASITVRYFARAPAPVFGALLVEVAGQQLTVPLTARGQEATCPVAVLLQPDAQARLYGVLELDGSASTDRDGPGGRPTVWTWTIVDRPEGSSARIAERMTDPERPRQGGPVDEPDTPTAVVYFDAIGLYVFELEVGDGTGCTDRIRFVVEVCPCGDDGIIAVLDWVTDPEMGEGSGIDLDLHLLHPNAENWFSRPYDCHYAEPVPDWGQLDNPADDPRLDQDRIGLGPERIQLGIPENTGILGASYLVGVHHNGYRPMGAVPAEAPETATAQLQIYVDGALVFEEQAELRDDNLWDAAGIEWPGGEVRSRGRILDTRP